MKLTRLVSGAVALALIFSAVPGCSGSTNADVEAVDPSRLPPEEAVYELAARGDVSGMKALLASNASLVNAPNRDGRTPLHFAAGNNQSKMADYLLEQGADPLAEDVDGFSPADAARQEGYLPISKSLMEAASQAQ